MNSTHAGFLAANERYRQTFTHHGLAAEPSLRVALLTCMDARVDIYRVLGLGPGQAHVVRNAGGVVTDDAIRSLTLSQRRLGTTVIAVIQHTRCGLENLDEEALLAELEADAGSRPPWRIGAFTGLAQSVRDSVTALRTDPNLIHVDAIEGYVYDVDTGRLDPVGLS